MGKNKEKIMKIFNELDSKGKEDAIDFMLYLKVKRNIRRITDKYGNIHEVFSFNIFR
jgi:hypothetical protein